MPDYTQLKGFDNLGDTTLSAKVQLNLIAFFDWGLMDKGGYLNVDIPSTGVYGGDMHKLRLVDDPNFTNGQIWEGFKRNWIWESGVSTSPAPIAISGVFVDGTFRALNSSHSDYSSTYDHYIDYSNGRIVFTNAISTTSTVTAAFTHKWVDVNYANGFPWFKELHEDPEKLDDGFFTYSSSGNWGQLGQTRLQLPAIAVEMVPRRTFRGYQLGGGQFVNTDVLFHIVSDDEYKRDKLVDVVSLQNEKTIWMYDIDKVATSGRFPLDHRGMLTDKSVASGALTYPDMVKTNADGGYRDIRLYLDNMSVQDLNMIHSSLYTGIVRARTEVILSSI